MHAPKTENVVDFELPRFLLGLAHVVERPLAAANARLVFEFGPELEVRLRGNCQRLGETLKNLILGALGHPDYGDILMVIHTEALGQGRTLLQFEIRSVRYQGPTFRFYAGLPLAARRVPHRIPMEIRA